ncbi:MAG: invasion associated locus B family protein [Alphaproteobacteria bacterium]|nr:invasion associated locus B family protein [Alphaproteobacteria bacterium]
MFIRAIAALALAIAASLPIGSATAQGQPAQSTEVLRETHGDWDIRCNSARPDECYMVQTASNDQGRPMVEFSLIRLAPGGPAPAGATAVVPLGTALPEGLLFQIDGGEPLRFAYDFCAPAGCIANLALTAEQVAAMKRGAQALITIKAASRPEIPVPVRVSLRGFTAAYESL